MRFHMPLAFTLFALASCVQTPIKRLPAFERAVSIAPQSAPKCVELEALDISALPALVPFALVSAQSDLSTKQVAGVMLANLEKLGQPPDLLVIQHTGRVYSGSVYSGGLSGGFSIPMHQSTTAAVAYRVAPARLGVQWDATGMVLAVADAARACGVLEGDRIVSFAGAPVAVGDQWAQSSHYVKALDLKPGDEIEVIWIRPGTGRMSGKAKLLPNTAMPPDLPVFDFTRKPVHGSD